MKNYIQRKINKFGSKESFIGEINKTIETLSENGQASTNCYQINYWSKILIQLNK